MVTKTYSFRVIVIDIFIISDNMNAGLTTTASQRRLGELTEYQ